MLFYNFFKKDLEYHSVDKITDSGKFGPKNLRKKIIKQLEIIQQKSDGIGYNPFVVNVITFAGHGITYDGDAIAVIPEYKDQQNKDKVLRFINFSDWARRLAQKRYTINIFILSMCRI